MELYAICKNYITPYLEAIENASLEVRAAAFTAFGDNPLPSIISRSENGTDATIKIIGPLSSAGPSPLARFFGFGGTGYMEIIAAAKELKNDPIIKNVDLFMDTPGGTIIGMDEARQALLKLMSEKTVVAQNHGQILSAGYYLATAATRIESMSPLATTGSIGVIKAGLDFTDAMAREGIRRIKIISSNAPNKHADPKTSQGMLVHQDEVDAVERVFIRKVAQGRKTTDQDVIDNFGKGGILIASDPDPSKPDALKVGMIDKVMITQDTGAIDIDSAINGDIIPETEAANSGGNQEGFIMDLSKLKAEHPALYAEVFTLGITQGATQERSRVTAHITLGEASGDAILAAKCIKEGTEHSAATNAQYMAAQMNKTAIGDRTADNVDDLDTDDTSGNADADEEALAAATAEKLGVELNG